MIRRGRRVADYLKADCFAVCVLPRPPGRSAKTAREAIRAPPGICARLAHRDPYSRRRESRGNSARFHAPQRRDANLSGQAIQSRRSRPGQAQLRDGCRASAKDRQVTVVADRRLASPGAGFKCPLANRPVQPVIANVIRDCGRQLRRRFSPRECVANIGRGHRQFHAIQSMHARAWRTGNFMSRPRHHDKFDRSMTSSPTAPGLDFRECVGADDEKQASFAHSRRRSQPSHARWCRSNSSSQPLFEPRGNEARICRAGQFHHAITLLEGRLGVLVWRIAGGDKQHAIELVLVRGAARHFKMGGVNAGRRSRRKSRSSLGNCSSGWRICCSNSSSLSIWMPIFNQYDFNGDTMALAHRTGSGRLSR